MEYLSVHETALKFKVSDRRIQKLCEEGRLESAKMISGVWLIPDNAEKPADERRKMIKTSEEYLNLNEFCRQLGISIATGKNWIKLEKIVPQNIVNEKPYFTAAYLETIKCQIADGSKKALQSRRNKKFVSGISLYNDYISSTSENLEVMNSILLDLQKKNTEEIKVLQSLLLAECAVQLFMKKKNVFISESYLKEFLTGSIDILHYSILIENLIDRDLDVLSIIEKNKKIFENKFVYEKNEDIIGLLYISTQNIAERKARGSYYTPNKIVKKLIAESIVYIENSSEFQIIDPCCGTGNFLLQLPEEIKLENIYGNDIDEMAIKIAKINLALKYEPNDISILDKNITNADYLHDICSQKFDVIIGNPPWGYSFTDLEKASLARIYNSAKGKNIESYNLFIEKALKNLKANGIVSYVLPEAILNVKAHLPIRKEIIRKTSLKRIDFLGNAFYKVQCPCIILCLEYTGKEMRSIGAIIENNERSFVVEHERDIEADNFAFYTTDDEWKILKQIDSLKNVKFLKNNADFALGIVTGDNKKYLQQEKTLYNEMVLKGSDIYKYKIIFDDNYLEFNPELFQQVAPSEYYRASEKLFYRFICNKLVFAYDNKQTLSLNSCNIVIPKINGLKIKYIMTILNSRIAQFIFEKKYNSVKILRSHIESIPIPMLVIDEQKRFMEYADMISKADDEQKRRWLYDTLDKEIGKLFGVTEQQYKTILKSQDKQNIFL